MSIRWPEYAGDCSRYDEISTLTVNEGLLDVVEHFEEQLGLPLVYFKLRVAMSGVVFKLAAKGTNSTNDRLSMLGPAEVIRCIYGGFYDYTLRAFPDLVTMFPMHPDRHASSIGAEKG